MKEAKTWLKYFHVFLDGYVIIGVQEESIRKKIKQMVKDHHLGQVKGGAGKYYEVRSLEAMMAAS